MSTQFLSRVDRIGRYDNSQTNDIGPGSYVTGGSIVVNAPGFIPFNTSDRRAPMERSSIAPPPGSYDIDDNAILKCEGAASALKSKTKRFAYMRPSDEPGPGDYILKSTIGTKKQIKLRKPKNIFEQANIPTASYVPSIPNKHQSYGYDYDLEGKLTLQSAQMPGYAGVRTDSVGPGDYEPKISAISKSTSCSNFSKSAERKLDLQTAGKGVPGPGYYNTPTEFDLQGNDLFNPNVGTDIVLQLKAARKRQSHMFESSTARNVFNEVITTKLAPGPGTYVIPTTIVAKAKPAEHQCFNSTVDRFANEPRSNRINTAPGSYTVPQSDFDTQKSQILKKKKMQSKSGWAQNIAFDATESRFFTPFKNDNPAPGTYRPKVTLADSIPRPNDRSGPFGSTQPRFKEPKAVEPRATSPYSVFEGDSRDIPSRPVSPTRQLRPAQVSTYASRHEGRVFRELERNVLYPPPGAYETTPSWDNVPGVLPMIPRKTTSLTKSNSLPEGAPGPGSYNLRGGIGSQKARNRKNVMITTSSREIKPHSDAPGPGYYNTSSSAILKPSFNIMLDNGKY